MASLTCGDVLRQLTAGEELESPSQQPVAVDRAVPVKTPVEDRVELCKQQIIADYYLEAFTGGSKFPPSSFRFRKNIVEP